jgi:hypothetical protein
VEPLERSRQHRVPGERVRQATRTRHRGRGRGEKHDDAAQRNDDDHDVAEQRGKLCSDRVRDARERRQPPFVAEPGPPILDREGRDSDEADRDRHRDHRADPREEAPRQGASRLTRLGREVGNRFETGVRQHRERKRKRELVPRRRGSQVGPAERVRIEEERETEPDQEDVRDDRDHRDDDREPVELGPPDEPDP